VAEPPAPVPPALVMPGDMPSPSRAEREWLLGTPFRFEGEGAGGLAAVAAKLVAAGSGSTAVVLATWSAADNGHYAWTATNRDGTVWWIDEPSHESSRNEPLYASIVDRVWAAVLAPDGRPVGAGPPVPASAAAARFDPARPTARDTARLVEIRALVDEYGSADVDGRVAIRVEIATLVDDLGVRPGTPESNARWAAMPADIAAHLLTLVTPAPTPRAVATVLAADPVRLNAPQRAWRDDFEKHLSGAFLGGKPASTDAVAAELADRMHRLAVAGETGRASVPRIPAYAGQVIGLPPDRLAVLRESDAALADRAGVTGIYVDLTGRPDLTPYAAPGLDPVALDEPPDDLDLSTDEDRTVLCAEDRARARAAFRAAHGADAQTMTVLTTHDFQYVDGGQAMALVPDLIAAAVRAIVPVRPAPLSRRPSLRKRRKPARPAPVLPPEQAAATTGSEPAAPAPSGPAPPGPAPSGPAASGPAAPGAAAPGPARVSARATVTVPATPSASAPPRTVRATASVPVQRTAAANGEGTAAANGEGTAAANGEAAPVDIAYYALADGADQPTGLLVVAMLPGGPQTARWEAPGARTSGSPTPVSRQRAEEISRQSLGFELPAEARLPELLNG
jgi:hypothetical protein